MKKRHLIAKLILSVLTLSFVYSQMDLNELSQHFVTVKPLVWIMASLFMIIQICLISLRWQYLININRQRLNYMDSLKISCLSNLANVFFITSIGGVLIRIGMATQYGISFLRSLAATLVDRVFSLLMLIFLSFVSIPAIYPLLPENLSILLSVVTLLSIAMIFVGLYWFSTNLKKEQYVKRNSKYGSILLYFRALFLRPQRMNKLIIISFLAQSSYFVSAYIILLSLGAEISLLDVFIVLPAIAFVASLPISIGGWGIREGAFVYGLSLLNIPMEIAFVASVEIGILSLISVLLLGAPAFFTQDVLFFFKKEGSRGKNREMS